MLEPDGELHTLRCAGCRRPIGVYETAQLRSAVWCSRLCHSQPAVTGNELRDDVMVELSRIGLTDGAIGTLFDIHRSRVQKVVAARMKEVA